jgi:hypothetical protein
MTPVLAWSHADQTLYVLVNAGPSPEDNRWQPLWTYPTPNGPGRRERGSAVSTLPLPASQAVEWRPMDEVDGRMTTPPPMTARPPMAARAQAVCDAWQGAQADDHLQPQGFGWPGDLYDALEALCGPTHPTEQDSPIDVLRAAVDDLANGLRAVSETLRLDGEPIVTAERLFDLVDPLTRVAAGMRTWPR